MDKVEEVLTRGVEKIYPSKDTLENVLRSGKKIKLYNGIDPTSPQLHLGHLVVLRKLRQFQDLGHEVIVLIGDFTARIGDPTDKLSTRHKLTKKQVEENAANYKNLIGRILDLKKSNIRFLHNEEWINELKPEDMLELASYFTVSQLLERDMFQQRIREGKEVYVHEFLYPIFQAYDSVTMDVDLEIGGNDQTFNMLAGRTLMKKLKNKEKFVLTTKLLTDPTGKKMGKTEGNIVSLDEMPTEMFGKVMAWPDEMIALGFELLTDVPIEEISDNTKPMDLKKKLAWEIVVQLHSKQEADKAQAEFERVFQKKEMPTEIETIRLPKTLISGATVTDVLAASGLVSSRAEAKRVISQGGTVIADQIVTDPNAPFPHKDETIIRVGKRRIVKIKI